ncbi:MAG: Smr/MutS family protein [Gammaproteobacteria bacterium]
MRKKSKHSKSDETALFRESVGDVRPVTGGRRLPDRPRPSPDARFSREDDRAALEESLVGGPEPLEIETGEELIFHRPQVTRRALRKLRRGQFAIQEEIDLHGMTGDEARLALRDFIRECRDRRLVCVRVIHGKGLGSGPRGPVLKAGVNRWLSRWDEVAAFCSARPRHGGTGAIYVLLNTLL